MRREKLEVFNFIHAPPLRDFAAQFMFTYDPFRINVTTKNFGERGSTDIRVSLACFVTSSCVSYEREYICFEARIAGAFEVNDPSSPLQWTGKRDVEMVMLWDGTRTGVFVEKGGPYSILGAV